MYNRIRGILFMMVKYRIHISIIFFFLLFYNNLKLDSKINYTLILSFFFWHFALFLFDRIYDRKIDKHTQPDEYVKENEAKGLYALVFSLLLLSFIMYLLSGFPIVFWFLLLPITFLYTYPIYKGIRAKNILFFKNLYSAVLIFTLPLYIQAYLLSADNVPPTLLKELFSLGVYILIGEVFWDIRDMSVDKTNNTHTIPNTFGLTAAKLFILALVIMDFVFTSYNFNSSGAIYLILITFTKENTDRLIFHLPPLIALLRFVL